MAKNLEITVLLDFYGSVLSEKQRFLTECYYFDDLSLAEIADSEGITRQGVRDIIKRSEEQLLRLEDCLGLKKRFDETQMGLKRIIELIDGMEEDSGSIERKAEEIKRIAQSLIENSRL